jgi:outer membrane protein TolC
MQYLTEWLKKWVVFAVFLIPLVGVSQKLTLQQVYDSAKNNYPLLKQKQIIEQTKELTINNLSKGLLPQVNISAQATYQSEVTKVNIPIPGVSIDPLSKDQYRIVADVSQTLYDGGITKQQKELQLLNANAENQKIEVELYKLKERVAQVYLSVLFIDEQLKQTELLKADIQSGIKKVQAQVSNGVAFKSNVNVLKAQLLQTNKSKLSLYLQEKD